MDASFDNLKVIYRIIFIISLDLNVSFSLQASSDVVMREKSEKSGLSGLPKSMPSSRWSLRSQSVRNAKSKRYLSRLKCFC